MIEYVYSATGKDYTFSNGQIAAFEKFQTMLDGVGEMCEMFSYKDELYLLLKMNDIKKIVRLPIGGNYIQDNSLKQFLSWELLIQTIIPKSQYEKDSAALKKIMSDAHKSADMILQDEKKARIYKNSAEHQMHQYNWIVLKNENLYAEVHGELVKLGKRKFDYLTIDSFANDTSGQWVRGELYIDKSKHTV